MSQGDLGAYLQPNTLIFQLFTQVGSKKVRKMGKKCAKMRKKREKLQEIEKKCKKLQLFERFFCTDLRK